MKSKLGLAFAGMYILVAAYFIFTQGLFGESFIALILGLPWILIPSFFEFWGIENDAVMMLFTIGPMVINVLLLYWIGSLLGRMGSQKGATMQ